MGYTDEYQKEVDAGKRDPADLRMAGMIDRDKASWERELREAGGDLYDPSDLDGVIRNLSYAKNDTGGASGDAATWIANMKQNYAQRRSSDGGGEFRDEGSSSGGGREQALSQVSQQYSSASNDALSAFLKQMQDRDAAQQAERGQLRGILMSQLGGLSQPVSREDPAMRGLFEGQRLSSQRESERMRSAAAESLGSRGLSDSGAMDTTLRGIEEGRAEKNLQFEGQTLYNEMNNRRQALQSLLSQALQIGDAEAARSIQAQLNAMQMQQNDSHFNDDSAYRYTALMSGLNSGAVSPFLY